MAQQLTDKHYQIAYDRVVKNELDRDEIKDLSIELNESDEYDRNNNSAEFLLSRMHILVHGIAPLGETESRAETMFTICDKMIDYANRMGLDTMFNIELARDELKDRPVRVKYDAAKTIMADYYKDHKTNLPKNITSHRNQIISRLMEGASTEDAFAV